MDPERFRSGKHANTPAPQEHAYDNLPPAPPPAYSGKAHKSGRRSKLVWLIPVAVVIVLAALAGWAYKSYKSKPAKTSHSISRQQPAASPGQTQNQAPSTPSIPSTSYSATDYNTTFSYPNSWTVTDSGTAPLTVTSPAMSLTAADGQSVTGQMVLTLAVKGSLPSAFGTQSVAVLTSQKIAYNQPSTTQLAQTYISFVQYPSTTTVGGLDGIYITGNYGYQKDQTIPAGNISAIDPLVYTSFYSCASQSCPASSRKPLTISSSDWQNTSVSAPLMLMFKSFTFN